MANVDVRLPDVATRCSMTMLHHILALVVDFVVAGKMSMSAEEFVSSLKLLQQREQERETGRGIMSFLIGIGQRLRLAERRIAEGKRNMIAEHHLLILGCKGQILLQPFHLALAQFSRRIIRHAAMEEAVVDADIMHIATVEGKIGRTEILLPFPAVERLAILVVIADDGEETHL